MERSREVVAPPSLLQAMGGRLTKQIRGLRWPWTAQPSHKTRVSGTLLFGRIRLSLTLWYCGVLATALLLFGVTLYIGVERLLLNRVQTEITERAGHWTQLWQQHSASACNQRGAVVKPPAAREPERQPSLPFAPSIRAVVYAACFNAAGTPITPRLSPVAPASFYATNLVHAAMVQGSASDTVDGGEGAGALYRYARAIYDPKHPQQLLGVIVLGESVEGQTEALRTLLDLLLAFGAVVLLFAAFGGHWLSKRALAPARLAYARQQDFIAAAAHELRTPLTLLRADAEVLLRGRDRLPPDDASLLEDIVTEAAHMASLASSMLTLARLDAGELRIEREVVDLADVAQAVARRAAAFATEQQMPLRVDVPTVALVVGDRLLLEQVAVILVDNAIKYSGQGAEILLRSYVEHGYAILQVQDTGVGISPEHLPRLGQRFFRLDTARSRDSGGAGLGLAIAQQLVEQHAGAMLIDSTPGEGTTVSIRLPSAGALPH